MTSKYQKQRDAKKAARTVCESFSGYYSLPSLQADEEKKHLRMMTEGDPHSRDLLIEHHLRLVAHIVKNYDHTVVDRVELASIGTIGLIKAIESYRPDSGVKLATYAVRCIENEILMHLRTLNKTCSDLDEDVISVSNHSDDKVLRAFMKTIHTSDREPYHIVASHLSQESKESMQRLNSLLGGAGQPGEEKPVGDRRS